MVVEEYGGGDEKITHITLTNASGASVTLSTLGAGIVSVRVPDSRGELADVVLGYAEAESWMNDGPCAGKVPGRFANRIARGRFTLDGTEYSLAINNGPNALHGGPTGFQNRIWELVEADDSKVTMEYRSADGEEGYPGNVTVRATYRWSDRNELTLELTARTDKATVINLTNHAYWNLGGNDSGSVLGHTLQLNASRYLPTDETLIPLPGEPQPVAGTPMDFTSEKALGKDIKADFAALNYGKGYDNCWVTDGYEPGRMQTAAVLRDPASGRTLTVVTDQPGVQIYTGNYLAGSPKSKSGGEYADYDGVAIECQDFPDAPNRADYPPTVLRPGEEYRRHIAFRFGT